MPVINTRLVSILRKSQLKKIGIGIVGPLSHCITDSCTGRSCGLSHLSSSHYHYVVYIYVHGVPRQLSWGVSADAGFVRGKSALLGDTIKETLCSIILAINQLNARNLLL